MPFMVGTAPIRNTLKYLNSGRIIFRDTVDIFAVNYNSTGEHHRGIREFIFWYMPQIQYQNPKVQCITFKNLTPSPFMTVFFNEGNKVLVDVDSRPKEAIRDHLVKFTAVCKTHEELMHEALSKEKKDNPANFGYGCERHCICEIPGQLPCPNIVFLPNHMRGKYKFANDD